MRIVVIPTIHHVPPLDDARTSPSNTLVFVGSFLHDPNVDAIVYFCNEIFPLIVRDVPDIQLRIIGSSPTPAVRALATNNVEVTGYVPDISSYLKSSHISIAPLRYGGGMKGKVGEAMAHGLPVVTTSIGTEGIGLTPTENVLIGETPGEFAQAVHSLLHDNVLYEKIRRNGWAFINDNYSEKAVTERVRGMVLHLTDAPVKRLAIGSFLKRALASWLDRHVLWRFKGPNR